MKTHKIKTKLIEVDSQNKLKIIFLKGLKPHFIDIVLQIKDFSIFYQYRNLSENNY